MPVTVVRDAPENLVLIVSELNTFSEAFHTFPERPVGLIEIVFERSYHSGLSSPCQRYCERHQLAYARVSRQNLLNIERYLKRWQATLVLTHSVPVLPIRLIEPLAHGGINLHHSKLPAYRGGNPLLWQVIDEVDRIGVSVHVLTAGADEGAILAQCEFDRPAAVSKAVLASMANRDCGLPLIKKVIPAWLDGSITPQQQPTPSPTSPANHISFTNLLSIVSERSVSLNGLWDLACCLERWPPEALPIDPWCRWVPESMVTDCCHRPNVGQQVARWYQTERVGSRLHLRHPDGCVVFRAQFHGPTLLAKLLL